MSELSELNTAINSLNDLWPLLEGDERESILEKRNILNEQASELADKDLASAGDNVNDNSINDELSETIEHLRLTTLAATDAKESIDKKGKVERLIKVVDKATSASKKVAKIIALL